MRPVPALICGGMLPYPVLFHTGRLLLYPGPKPTQAPINLQHCPVLEILRNTVGMQFQIL